MRMRKWWFFWYTQVLASLIFKVLPIVSLLSGRLLFFSVRAIGLENLPKHKEALIIAPKHHSFGDHFFIAGAMPLLSSVFPVRAIAADWLFKNFFLRWTLKAFGCYPAKRGMGLDVSLRGQLRVLKKGGTALIYPEAGIKVREGVSIVKPGAVYLAQKTGAPILPISFRGLERLTWWDFFFGRRKVTVLFGEKFHVKQVDGFDELPDDEKKEILSRDSELLKARMNALYEVKTA